jgi:hypothetical protein
MTRRVKKKLICERCHKKKASVKERIDPYDQDVNETIRKVFLCDGCYRERAEDI